MSHIWQEAFLKKLSCKEKEKFLSPDLQGQSLTTSVSRSFTLMGIDKFDVLWRKFFSKNSKSWYQNFFVVKAKDGKVK